MKISPIIGYYGCKRRLLDKGLLDKFPKGIDTFYDMFAGSASVALNVDANNYVINDINSHVYDLYKMFKEKTADTIIEHIEYLISLFDLNKTNCNYDDKDRDKYNTNYLKLREYANKTNDILDFYTLIFHSFNYLFRFNSEGKFNAPFGQRFFREEHKRFIEDGCHFFSQDSVKLTNLDFRNINISNMTKNDFVYLDPPYFDCRANYNERNGWLADSENGLHDFCDKLDKQGIKFAMSNVAKIAGQENKQLLDWVRINNYSITEFTDCINYTACSNEVLITNY